MGQSGGLAADPYGLPLETAVASLGNPSFIPYMGLPPFLDTKGRTRAAIPTVNVGTWITFGQSKIDNAVAGDVFNPVNLGNIYNLNIWDGACYTIAVGAGLLGNAVRPDNNASLYGMSYAVRLASKVIAGGAYSNIVLVPIAVAGAMVVYFGSNGVFRGRFPVLAKRVADAGLTVTHCIWDQGETDKGNGTSAAAYTAGIQDIRAILNNVGITAPMWVALTSFDGASTGTAVRTGQSNSVNGTSIRLGPDLDSHLGPTYRADTVHYNVTGADDAASMWKTALGL